MTIYNTQNHFADLINFFENDPTISKIDLPIVLYKNNQQHLDKFIFYNTEQTYDGFDYTPLLDKRIVEVWDYSLKNIEFFESHGIKNLKHVPPVLWDEYRNKLLSYNLDCTYDYDVAFVGAYSQRRGVVLENLEKRGIRVKIQSHDFGEVRDRDIAKSKILINIHYSPNWKIFERVRCFAWIGINKTIISENSLDNDDKCINVEYDDLVSKTEEILSNF